MCFSLMILQRGNRLWRNLKRPLLRKFHHTESEGGRRMSHILKSPFDKKKYREVTLKNGLTALLISDMDQSATLPLQGRHRHNQLVRKSVTSSSSETDGTSGGDSEEPMSGTEAESESEGPPEVPGLLASLAKERSRKKHKRGCNVMTKELLCRKCGNRFDPNLETPVESIRQDDEVEKQTVEVIMAAAALCIGVGSFYDPDDIPGFAHFLEHMVFMGSKKYKKENAFDDFITKHGGETNAWTDAERTTFFFDIHKSYFRKGLDMFAQCFISPLFLKSSVDREIMAVDNEFQMICANDSDRYHQLIGSLAFLGNPLSRFLCGNKKTLKTIPEDKGIDVYGRLRDFHRRMYSAHYMTLVIQAPETLDDLQNIVYELFEDIPNNKLLIPPMAEYKNPFVPRNFHKLFKVIPIEDCQRLDICWALPPMYKHFKTKPLEYIGVLMTHEGPGSILSFLRKKAWALSLSGGNMGNGFDQNKLWSGFFVSVVLTDSGMEQVSQVIRTVFEYVLLLQKCGPQLWFHTELSDIENIKFRYREEMDPIDNVEQVAENMQLYPLEHYLTGRSLILAFDSQLIRECQSYLVPSQACLSLWSKAYETEGICNKVDPWFHTRYTITEIPEDWKEEWRNLTGNQSLFMPEKNSFIPTEFELLKVEGATEYPTQLLDNEFGRMWYKKDDKFKMPKGFILLHLMTKLVSSSVTNAALCDLFINIIQQQLLESLYPATLAGYEFSLEGLSTGVTIQVEGFSHKLPDVACLIVEHMAEFTVSEELFNAVKSQLKKCYYNEMIKTYDFAKMLRFALTEPTNPPLPDRYRVTNALTIDMLLEFYNQLMGSLYIEGLVTGNFSPQHAVNIGEYVQKKLCHKPLSSDSIPVKRLLKVPAGDLQCRVRGVNRSDTSSCVTSYYQNGPGTIRDWCLNELLSARMKEPLFNKLRTELQLGYSVFCQPLNSNGILGFAVTVEAHANKFSMSEIREHIADFMQSFQKILCKMTKLQFGELVNSVVTAKQVEDTQLGDETSRYWQEILDRYYIFNRQEKEIAALKSINHAELKAWYQKYLNSSHRHISFQVEGCKQLPMEIETQGDVSGQTGKEIELTSAAANGQCEDFLKLIVDGEGFITDVAQFRQSLSLYPISKVTD